MLLCSSDNGPMTHNIRRRGNTQKQSRYHIPHKMRSFTLITTALLLATISSINGLSSVPTLIPGEVNSQLAYAKSKFPIASDDLINRAKEVLSPNIEIGTKDNGECLADDFEFVAAVVGPLPKKEYLDALGSFKLVSRELCLLFCYYTDLFILRCIYTYTHRFPYYRQIHLILNKISSVLLLIHYRQIVFGSSVDKLQSISLHSWVHSPRIQLMREF